ncbi:MAG: RNA methyltransferase [Deltaproteobacteria bacterium]|nr:RNA methyltransferase [Deltaproteobacteria bacterium]
MSRALSSLLDFILVRPQYPGNAGAVARALKNCEFEKLILVNPVFDLNDLDVKRYSVGAYPLIEKAPVVKDLPKALEPYHFVIGTTRRRGRYRQNTLDLSELPGFIAEQVPKKSKVALLFGNEMNGLSNEEFALCQHLVTIPANPKFESYNLSQAVLLVAHELYRFNLKPKEEKKAKLPSVKELEGMYEHLTQMLLDIGFVRNNNPEHIPRILRNLFNRAQITDPEKNIIRGICRQVQWVKGQWDKLKD